MPGGFGRMLGWSLGLSPAEDGQGTDWAIDADLPGIGPWPPWARLILVAVIVAVVVRGMRRDIGARGRGKTGCLIGLRLAALALIALMLSHPTLQLVRTALPTLMLVIDTSESMSLTDRPAVEAPFSAASASPSSAPPSRLVRVQDAILNGNGAWLDAISRGHRLQIFQMTDQAQAIALDDVSPEAQRDVIKSLSPAGRATRPGPSIQQLLTESRGSPPTAIIVLTDGAPSLGETDALSTVAEAAKRSLVPLFPVGVGRLNAGQDVQLADLLADDLAFLGDPVLLTGRLSQQGYEGKSASVQIRVRRKEKVSAGDGREEIGEPRNEDRITGTETVPFTTDGQGRPFELSWIPDEAGTFDVTVTAMPQPGEINLRNNTITREITVREEKIRVLLAESSPRYEFRYLKQLLEREKSVELTTYLQDADPEYAQEDRTALASFPVRDDDLQKFDVILWGDVDLSVIGESVLKQIVDRVRNDGLGIAMIAGSRFNPWTYDGSPLEPLLPFDPEDVLRGEEGGSLGPFHPVLTPEGQKGTRLFRLANTEAESLTLWPTLAPWLWFVAIQEPSPAALTFVEHPQRRGIQGPLPLILLQRVGAGKVLYHATDETWRWRYRMGDTYFGRYWVQVLRSLGRSLHGRDRSMELMVDREEYESGDDVQFRIRVVDDRLISPGHEGVLVRVGAKGRLPQNVSLSRVPRTPNVFEGRLTKPEAGEYHAFVAQPVTEGEPASVNFRVTDLSRELQDRRLHRADLEKAAGLSHGRYLDLEEIDQLPALLPPGIPTRLHAEDPIPLWSRPEWLVLLAAIVSTEWVLRRHWRLV